MADAFLEPVRERTIIELDNAKPTARDGFDQWLVRGQTFLVEWNEAKAAGVEFDVSTAEEAFVILPSAGATLKGENTSAVAKTRSMCILPPGKFKVTTDGPGTFIFLYSDPAKMTQPGILNAHIYADPDPRVKPVGKPFKRVKGDSDITVFEVDKITTQGKNDAMKVLQCATMNCSWVDRRVARDRKALSPHVHDDFEQATVAIKGEFIHHLRVDWGKNAELWRDDEHVHVGPRHVLMIPAGLVHSTEGIKDEHHLHLDVFAPARRDFIAKGFIANSGDYAES